MFVVELKSIDMKYLMLIMLGSVVVFTSGCKGKSQTDPVLLEAFDIQHEAIHIGDEVESMIKEGMANDTTAAGKEKYSILMEAYTDWKNNMVEVPGVEHDHSGHDHDHSHSHSASPAAAHLTPEEVKQVQTEWKNAITAIKESINQ